MSDSGRKKESDEKITLQNKTADEPQSIDDIINAVEQPTSPIPTASQPPQNIEIKPIDKPTSVDDILFSEVDKKEEKKPVTANVTFRAPRGPLPTIKEETPQEMKIIAQEEREEKRKEKSNRMQEAINASILQNKEYLIQAYTHMTAGLAQYAQDQNINMFLTAVIELDKRLTDTLKTAAKNSGSEPAQQDLSNTYDRFFTLLNTQHHVSISAENLQLLNNIEQEIGAIQETQPNALLKIIAETVSDMATFETYFRKNVFNNQKAEEDFGLLVHSYYFSGLSNIMSSLHSSIKDNLPVIGENKDLLKVPQIAMQKNSLPIFTHHFATEYKAPLSPQLLSPKSKKPFFHFFEKSTALSDEENTVLQLITDYHARANNITKNDDLIFCNDSLSAARTTLEVIKKENPQALSVQQHWLEKISGELEKVQRQISDTSIKTGIDEKMIKSPKAPSM